MPEWQIHQTPTKAHVVALPPVWGLNVVGQVGDRSFALVLDGLTVCRRYRAPRTGWIVNGHGRRSVQIAGSGGHATRKPYRRHGYNAALDRAFLAAARTDGFDLAVLFCVEAQAAYNARLGWWMMDPEACLVTYRQPRSGIGQRCPSHIRAGVQALSPGIEVQALTAIEIEGFPW